MKNPQSKVVKIQQEEFLSTKPIKIQSHIGESTLKVGKSICLRLGR